MSECYYIVSLLKPELYYSAQNYIATYSVPHITNFKLSFVIKWVPLTCPCDSRVCWIVYTGQAIQLT